MIAPDALDRTVVLAVAKACSCDAESLHAVTTIDEIGLDSLGLEAVISEVQETCGIELTADQLMKFFEVATIEDIAAVFKTAAHGARAHAGP